MVGGVDNADANLSGGLSTSALTGSTHGFPLLDSRIRRTCHGRFVLAASVVSQDPGAEA
jgi:hypothetical protein